MKKYDAYEDYIVHDKINIAKELIDQTSTPIEKRPEVLKDIIDMDLRENVPPQIYEVISCVVEMIEKVEKK